MRRSDRLSPIIEIVQDGRLHLARDIAERLALYQCEQFIVILILSLRLAFQSKASAVWDICCASPFTFHR
jgi:hypothetical protein